VNSVLKIPPLPLPFPIFTSLRHYFYASIVFSKPRRLDTESELYDVALRALMRRPHSIHEMQKLLRRRASSDLLTQVVLARLKENGSLNDDRYAKQFTRQRTEIRRQGKFRIARDLRARGVPAAQIQSAIEDASDDSAERAAIRHRIDRKLKLTLSKSGSREISDKKIASLYRSLLAAGFPSDAIRRELKSLTAEEVPTIDDPQDGEN
jgi:regulatory protein